MQPQETSSIFVHMGTATPAAWNPMATEWAGDYTYMGHSVMMTHSVMAGSQTQYYK